ncbi:hypothetical protein GCM10010082_09230 [Kushneria pakistanensis]|uniref:Lipoprotein n=1 Tax=Kushneria pakistanensis TaxID=1508770 RepID=A0ABQ3FDM7_9GAMM|nr:hypothetical protein [Kushneria pakistanensis]GHC19683.1 hypothetical protein GCM10010082_09230 [Kushneria pakistanensis]
MMKKTWIGVATLTLMTGCVSGQYVLDDQVSQSREINPVQGVDGDYLGSFAVRRPYTEVTPVQLDQCLDASVQQQQVNLATGVLRDPIGQKEKMTFNAMPGEGDEAGVTGVTQHEGRNIAYRLEIQRMPEANYYYFDRLGEASGQNDQFVPIGAWAEAAPLQATQGLEAVADQMQSCLERGATNQPGEDPTGWQPQS